jgi:hypothetical protein
MMDDREARLECLKLAVTIMPRAVESPVDTVVEIASQLYNHISEGPQAASAVGGLTARADKPKGPAVKR